MQHPILFLSAGIAIINLPFGFWRANTKKYSLRWFSAIHIPILIAIALRLLCGFRFGLSLVAALSAAFFIGQFWGSKISGWRKESRRKLL
jgi:hypothetical protein